MRLKVAYFVNDTQNSILVLFVILNVHFIYYTIFFQDLVIETEARALETETATGALVIETGQGLW